MYWPTYKCHIVKSTEEKPIYEDPDKTVVIPKVPMNAAPENILDECNTRSGGKITCNKELS